MAESVAANKTERAKKKALDPVVVGSVDSTVADVLKYAQEGRNVFFQDKKDFLEVPEQIVKELNLESRERYGLAQRITRGDDIITAMEDGARGWTKDYNVKPGSFGDNTTVFGKDPNFDYYLSSPRKLSTRVAEEWEIDRDPNVHMIMKETGTLKTVGGENKPELILVRRKKEIAVRRKKETAEKAKNLIQRTKESFVESANRLGVVAKIDD